MKKILLIFALCLCIFSSKAQDITGLDEVALLGNWSVHGYVENADMKWPIFNGYSIAAFHFVDYWTSTITIYHKIFKDYHTLNFNGYIVGGTATGKYTLHFTNGFKSDTWDDVLPQVNFIIKSFDGNVMRITSYDGKHGAYLVKDNAGAGSVNADASEAEISTYDIKGLPVENPTAPGIYIQSDGKKFAK